jgi:hypothetical protein
MYLEAYIAIALLVILIVWGGWHMFSWRWHQRKYEKAIHARFRFALRRNINELIIEAIVSDDGYKVDPMLQVAIRNSIQAYREHG